MPINKNALLRYQILDRCFSDRHRRYEIEDLVDKVNDALLDMYGKTVSLRQIRAAPAPGLLRREPERRRVADMGGHAHASGAALHQVEAQGRVFLHALRSHHKELRLAEAFAGGRNRLLLHSTRPEQPAAGR